MSLLYLLLLSMALYQSVFMREIDITQDTEINKNLQGWLWWPPQNQMRKNAEVWSAHWRPKHSVEGLELPTVSHAMGIHTERLQDLHYKCKSLLRKSGDDAHGEGKDWSSSAETKAHLSFLSPLSHPALGRVFYPWLWNFWANLVAPLLFILTWSISHHRLPDPQICFQAGLLHQCVSLSISHDVNAETEIRKHLVHTWKVHAFKLDLILLNHSEVLCLYCFNSMTSIQKLSDFQQHNTDFCHFIKICLQSE